MNFKMTEAIEVLERIWCSEGKRNALLGLSMI